ncbi:hypothetical protein L207DRAFT_414862, partial [Hyaloscypha variabilis F]
AAEGGQEEVVKHLLERGAALESKDKDGRAPLSWAAGSGHDDLRIKIGYALKSSK